VNFAQWIFLFGAVGVVGPLIAHLLAKPRFRRIPFTMLRFLQAGQTESQSRRRFRDLLVLLLRCGIIVLIAMLFARPRLIIEATAEKPRATYYVGLDNSMSMAYADEAGRYFDRMIDSAVKYIRSAEDDGLFNICAVASGTWAKGLNKEMALAEVKKLRVVPNSARVSEFLSVVRGAGNKRRSEGKTLIFICSDFTPKTLKEFLDVTEGVVADSLKCEQIVSSKPVDNAGIIEAHIGGISDGSLILNATVINYGEVPQERRLAARSGQKESAAVDVKLGPGQSRTYLVQMPVDLGGQEQLSLPVELSLSEGDGLKDDDTFYLAVLLPRHKSIKVLLVDSGGDEMFLLRTAMNTLSQMDLYDTVTVKQVTYEDLKDSELGSSDVVVCSAINAKLSDMIEDLKSFVTAGGKLIFFMTAKAQYRTAKQLWQEGLLAALPGELIATKAHIEPRIAGSQPPNTYADDVAAKSLSNYKIDRIVLKGYFECKPHAESFCPCRLGNGPGFVFCKGLGNGSVILVNTSVDDSLGGLTKSSASVAFCRYLLGKSKQVSECSFTCEEQVMLPASEVEMHYAKQKQFWVSLCDGRQSRAGVSKSLLLIGEPGGIGWVKTLAKPIRYAGINLPKGETDMTRPSAGELAGITKRTLFQGREQSAVRAGTYGDTEYKPLWKIVAWILIALLLLEPAVANRLRR